MACKSHEIFFPTCGHVFRCKEPAIILDQSSYDSQGPRRPLEPHKPHISTPSHPCNKHLTRTISSADRSPIGSWRICPECEGGPKLPDHFKLQEFSCKDAYWEWDWEKLLEEMKAYYENEIAAEAQVEWCCEDKYGRDWNLGANGYYEWERQEGRQKSCHVRSAEQQLRENRFSDA